MIKKSSLICTVFKNLVMLIGQLTQSDRIEAVHNGFKKLFDFIKSNDFNALPLGKVEVDSDNIYIMNLDIAKGANQDVQPLEMHRKYIDVHVLLEGNEKIGWKPLAEIANLTQQYEENGDCALSDDASRFFVDLHPGEYCIVFPEDPHAPAISEGRIRKLIGKVKI